jgi:DNA-binding transcriptional LysR family regulator
MWSHGRVEIRELRVFVAVIEEGGMSAAARRLHMGQSTVSETISALERELGAALLMRTRSGVHPTEPGLALAEGARKLIHLHDRVRATVKASGDAGGIVRLGVPLELPVDFLPQVVATVSRESPGVTVDASHRSTTSQWASLRRGEIDLGLVRELAADDDYDSVLVISEAMGVVLSDEKSQQLGADDGSVRLDRLSGLRWNGFPRSDSPFWYDHVAATLRSHGVAVPESDPEDRRPVTAEVKLASVGDGTRFALAAPEFPLPRGLQWHPLAGHPLVRRTWAVWPAQSRSSAVAAVVAALEDWASPTAT